MENNEIGVVGFWGKNSQHLLDECQENFAKREIALRCHNISGHVFNAIFDFTGLDFIIMNAGLILQSLVSNGLYDFLKLQITMLWGILRKPEKNNSTTPFFIKVGNVPTPSGDKNISFRFSGELTDEQKTLVIEKSFETIQKISEGSMHLMALTRFHEAFSSGNLLNIDPKTLEVSEVDIEAEIRKKFQK